MPSRKTPKPPPIPPATVKRDSRRLADLAAPPAKSQPTKDRRAAKRDYYAWLYGSYSGLLVAFDFFQTYCMGGEL